MCNQNRIVSCLRFKFLFEFSIHFYILIKNFRKKYKSENMYKIQQMKRLLECDLCNDVILDPVTLPCDNTICRSHLDKLLTDASNEKNTFLCLVCHKEHIIPKKGFIVNNRIQKLLTLDLNIMKASPLFDECIKEIENAKENVLKVEELQKNGEMYIYDYFENIKRQVDIRREDLKLKIDNFSDEIIKSVELNQKSYIKLSKEVNKITENINKSKNELNDLIAQFDTLEFNDKKFQDTKASVAVVNLELSKILAEYQDSLLDNKIYTFKFKELPIEDIFGRFFYFNVSLIILISLI